MPRREGSQPERKKNFVFGEAEDDDLPEEPESLEPEVEDPEPPAPPAEPVELDLGPAVDALELAAAAENVLNDPSLKAITEINQERFLSKAARPEEGARVTRSWLNSLTQRDFFLAIAYPGTHLLKLLEGMTSLGQIRAWVDGVEPVSDLVRRILTLEHLLDRRTLANRQRMPTRRQIEDAIRVMPRTGSVSEVLGGFENIPVRDLERHPQSKQIQEGTVGEVQELMRIVKPGEQAPQKARPGSSLPVNKRLLGQGRPLGQMLLKPDPYCYSLSKKSIDKLGNRHITPQQAMELINKAAQLEQQYNVLYSIRRKNTLMPWSLNNIEFLPTEEVEREKGAAARRRREEP